MSELYFDPEPDEELARLQSDPAQDKLLERVSETLDLLEQHPTAPSLRRHRFSNGLWYVRVPFHDGDYAVLWEPYGDAIAVRYLGPDFR